MLKLSRNNKVLKGEVHLPSSKSISNRALIIQALCDDKFFIKNLSTAGDTKMLSKNIGMIHVCGRSGIPMIIDSGNAGTVMRFLTSLLAIKSGKWLLIGDKRMKNRPIAPLADGLKKIGASIQFTDKAGYPPLLINGGHLVGGHLTVDAQVSSQFVSSILMIAPLLPDGLILEMPHGISSKPYIEMTISMMQYFGIEVNFDGNKIEVKNHGYAPKDIVIETDWSSAAYWFEMVSLSEEANILLSGLKKESLQGDSCLVELYKDLGVETTFEENGIRLTKREVRAEKVKQDFINIPDLAPSYIFNLAALGLEAEITGIENLSVKESDRIQAIRQELEKIGFAFEEKDAVWYLTKTDTVPEDLSHVVFETYNDHRMALSIAPLALKFPYVNIEEPEVISKSYPEFWDHLTRFDFVLEKH